MLSTVNEQRVWFKPIPNRENKTMMEILFNRLSGTYPNKWRANFQGEKSVAEWEQAWAEAFDEDGITPHDVALGIKNCRQMYDWPPSLTEFLRACRPYLEADVAFFEAVREMRKRSQGEDGMFSHPAIYHAAVMIGQHDLMNCSYQVLSNRWKAALSSQLSLGQWADIPAVVPALPPPVRTDEHKQAARQVTSMVVDASLGVKNPLRWIERALTNPKATHHAKKEAMRIAHERNIDVSKFQNVVSLQS